MTVAPPLIEARRVSLSFPGVLALSEVDFDIHPGEVHVLPGLDGGRQAVAEGKLDATFVYSTGGRQTVELATPILAGEQVPHKTVLPTEKITRDNALG